MPLPNASQIIARVLGILLVLSVATSAHAQSLAGVKLGAAPITLETLPMKPTVREGNGVEKVTKFKLPNGNNLSVTYDSKANKIRYIELDWNNTPQATNTGVGELFFGQTTLNDIRKRNGSNGFAWKRVVMHQRGEQMIMFNAYEVRNKPGAIVVFVTLINIPEYKASPLGDERLGSLARLNAIILASEDYLDEIWGAEKVYDGTSISIAWPK
jgi:hypothetical protein